jgi:hypothetical protein
MRVDERVVMKALLKVVKTAVMKDSLVDLSAVWRVV